MKKNSNFKKFLLLWFGELVSSIGGGLTSFGLGVYIFSKTGSAASMTLVTLLAFLPTLLLSPVAGVLADRYDRRKLMIIGDSFSAIGIIYILICMLNGEAHLYQICIGVFISSVFSSLLEPSYRASISELLTKEEYSKASGMVNIAGSVRYLISPILAAALLSFSDIKLLLIIDISTFILTVLSTAVVSSKLINKKKIKKESFSDSFKTGIKVISENKGILILLFISSLITCFMGTIQVLAEPLILSFSNSSILGISETICACGMLVSSLYLGAKGIKNNYVRVFIISLLFSGLCMIGFSLIENIYIICLFGFFFFFMLPFANNSLDYLIRTNIKEELQGRAWGLIGFISQIGYVIAYSISGISSDFIAKSFDISIGRGSAYVIMISGILLCLVSIATYYMKSIRTLEK